jgi:hypothetical protein
MPNNNMTAYDVAGDGDAVPIWVFVDNTDVGTSALFSCSA